MSLPWYKFYVNDWQRSETRAAMTLAERGLYRELLDIANTVGSIPKNPRVLIGLSLSDPKEFHKCWPRVSMMFEEDPQDTERLINSKATEVFAACGSYLERQRVNGAKGGRKRKPTETHGLSGGKPMGSDSLKRASTKKDKDTDTDKDNPPGTPPSWHPWPDAEAAREAILEGYPKGKNKYAMACSWWQNFVVTNPRAPQLASRIFDVVCFIRENCPDDRREFLPNAVDFLSGDWQRDWAAEWRKAEPEGKFEATMRAIEEAGRTA